MCANDAVASWDMTHEIWCRYIAGISSMIIDLVIVALSCTMVWGLSGNNGLLLIGATKRSCRKCQEEILRAFAEVSHDFTTRTPRSINVRWIYCPTISNIDDISAEISIAYFLSRHLERDLLHFVQMVFVISAILAVWWKLSTLAMTASSSTKLLADGRDQSRQT